MEKSEIPEILNFMNALYPNRKLQINAITTSVWHEMLKDFKKEDVKNAIKDIANSQQYIPNLPEIVKRIQPTFLLISNILEIRTQFMYVIQIRCFRFDSKIKILQTSL